ncbi:MAG: DUF433 domain-containing protein [Planctomycetaceae bacterium]|nr:DUF433 domain-containing protein [Planctomycetaceae bacterium]
MHIQKILDTYPALHPEDVQAAISYAADLVRERTIHLPAETL